MPLNEIVFYCVVAFGQYILIVAELATSAGGKEISNQISAMVGTRTLPS